MPHCIRHCLSALVLLCGISIFPSCERASDGAVPRQFHSWTSDVILTDSARYLVDRSPLKGVKGYEKFFFLGEEILMYNGIPGDDDGRADMFPSHGECEKEYIAVWKLADSMLFLTGLDPLSNRVGIKGDTQHIRPMKEILIGRSLIDEETPLDGTPIPCTWVTGTYYVKKGSEHYGNIYADYQTRPFYEMIFENGRLLSVRRIETQPRTQEDSIAYEKERKRFYKKWRAFCKIRHRKAEERIKKTDEENRKESRTVRPETGKRKAAIPLRGNVLDLEKRPSQYRGDMR